MGGSGGGGSGDGDGRGSQIFAGRWGSSQARWVVLLANSSCPLLEDSAGTLGVSTHLRYLGRYLGRWVGITFASGFEVPQER